MYRQKNYIVPLLHRSLQHCFCGCTQFINVISIHIQICLSFILSLSNGDCNYSILYRLQFYTKTMSATTKCRSWQKGKTSSERKGKMEAGKENKQGKKKIKKSVYLKNFTLESYKEKAKYHQSTTSYYSLVIVITQVIMSILLSCYY